MLYPLSYPGSTNPVYKHPAYSACRRAVLYTRYKQVFRYTIQADMTGIRTSYSDMGTDVTRCSAKATPTTVASGEASGSARS